MSDSRGRYGTPKQTHRDSSISDVEETQAESSLNPLKGNFFSFTDGKRQLGIKILQQTKSHPRNPSIKSVYLCTYSQTPSSVFSEALMRITGETHIVCDKYARIVNPSGYH